MQKQIPTQLIRVCSRVDPVEHGTIVELTREIAALDLPWTENYSEYQSGGWKTLALYNSNGDSQSNDLEDGAVMPTDVARRLPRLRELIEQSSPSLMWARLLRLDPGACLWEHTDYGAANLRRDRRVRLHLPLVTNPRAVLVFPSHTVHMRAGYWWKLSADEERHGACNFGDQPRLHVILDCYLDAALSRRLSNETLDPACVEEKPPLSSSQREQLALEADALLQSGRRHEAESVFRRAFHRYALGAVSSYDLLVEYFESRSHSEGAAYWRGQRRVFLNANVPGHPFFEGASE
jgi:hypothetical protein